MLAVSRTFVGRERELLELEAGLEQATAGRGQLYLIAGEAGIGKTRLCDELALRAADRGLLVRWGRCWEVGGAPAYWPWIQLLRALLRERRLALEPSAREMLARILPELGGQPAALADSAEQRFQLFDTVTATLRETARATPLLLILDDLHAADPSSLALLLFVARELRDLRLCLIGTYRDREVPVSPDAREVIARIVREAQTLEVSRFTPDEVRALLVSRLGRVDDGTVKDVLSATEGLPLFVNEVARSRPAAGHWIVPDTIRAALSARVDALAPAAREVMDAAAVLGRETSRAMLASLLGYDEAQLQLPLSAALAAGIAAEPEPGVIAFSHALLRDAIYRELPDARRLELHERAADLLERESAPETGWGEVAHHLLAARSRVGTERALRGSLEAAQRALGTFAFEDAGAIIEHALREVGTAAIDPRLHCEMLLLLGEALIRSHRDGQTACLRAAELARQLADPALLAQAGLALGAEIFPGRVSTTLIAVLDEALRALPNTPSPLRARVLARLAGAMQPATDPNQPIAIAREAIAMARAIGDEASLRIVLHGAGAALVDYAPILERLDVDSQTLALAEAARDWPLAFRARLRLFFDHVDRGVWSEAEDALRGCDALANKLRRPRLRWYVAMMQAVSADVHGDFAAGDAYREQARSFLDTDDGEGLRTPYTLHCFASALLRHDDERLFDLLPVLPASAVPLGLADAVRTTLLAVCHVRSGRLDQAQKLLSRLDLNAPSVRHELMSLHLFSEVCAPCGMVDAATIIASHLQSFGDGLTSWGVFGFGVFGPVNAMRANAWSVAGRHDEAIAAFEEAVARCRELRLRPALARTLYDEARARARRNAAGDAGRAQEALRQAGSLARELGMPGLVRWVEAAAAALSGERPAPSEPSRVLAALDATRFSLEREGDVWVVTHGSRVFRLKHTRGLAMLAQLVANPGREQHALSLGESGDPGDLGDAGGAIDPQAVRAYRERIEELREREQTAESLGDSVAADRARSELDQIAQHLSAALGLGGKSRKSASAAERARVNVQRRIKDAILRIAREDPELGRYLGLCVRTGTFSVFQPIR